MPDNISYLGPWVSQITSRADGALSKGTFHIPSWSSLSVNGRALFGGHTTFGTVSASTLTATAYANLATLSASTATFTYPVLGSHAMRVIYTASNRTVALGTAALDSISTTLAAAGSGITMGDHIIVTPPSAWSGAYYDIALSAFVTSADSASNATLEIVAVNSAATAINTDPLAMRVTALRFG